MARSYMIRQLGILGMVAALQLAAAGNVLAKPGNRIGWRESWHKAREEMQVYRGKRLERWGDRLAMGRSSFNPKLSVGGNLKALVKDKKIPHYYAKVNGKDVLHVVVDLAQPGTKKKVRQVLKRVAGQTIEVNYKGATPKNTYGHVAVRVGGGATYDLTGSRGVAELPKFLSKTLKFLRGSETLTFARKRSLRRFMESRKQRPGGASASVYFGMLYGASPAEIKTTEKLYDARVGQVKEFNVSGGDATKGVFSCAQFLSEGVPFLNERGMQRTVGAKSMAGAAHKSAKLEAVVVYKMPGVGQDQLHIP